MCDLEVSRRRPIHIRFIKKSNPPAEFRLG